MFIGSPIGLVWGAAFTLLLAIGCITDVRTRRIPNVLVIAILIGGLLYAVASGNALPALGRSLAGVAAGFGIWIVFYIIGVIGAGDVKFFAAAGAWLGPAATWRAALIAALAGGVLALIFLLRERRLGTTMRRIALAASSRSLTIVSTPGDQGDHGGASSAPQRPLPYGLALAVGALVAAWVPLTL